MGDAMVMSADEDEVELSLDDLTMDVYINLAKWLSYQDINNLIKAIPIALFRDPEQLEIFWHLLTLERYPGHECDEGLTSSECYHQLATQAGEYTPGSERYIDINDIVETGLENNPDAWYFFMSVAAEDGLDAVLPYIAKGGHMDILKNVLSSTSVLANRNIIMNYASEGGHMDIVDYMISLGASSFDQSMIRAARYGHISIVKFMFERGVSIGTLDVAMSIASQFGHLNIVHYLLSKDAHNYIESMESAAAGGHLEIVKLMVLKGANSYDMAMYYAAKNDHAEVYRYLLEHAGEPSQESIDAIACYGSEDIFYVLLEHGIHNMEYMMQTASGCGSINIVKLLLANVYYDEDDINMSLIEAAGSGHRDIVELLLDCGAEDIYEAMDIAQERCNFDMVKLLGAELHHRYEMKDKM